MSTATLADPDKTIVVIGGGWWGHLHASRLLLARERHKTAFSRLLVVDRRVDHDVSRALAENPLVACVTSSWDDFLDSYLDEGWRPGDLLIPAPIAPHLLYGWLIRHLGRNGVTIAPEPIELAMGTPYDTMGPQGERFVSFAEWQCPVSCLEPSICPAIRQPRTWEVEDHLRRLATQVDSVEIFVARHHAWGIASIPVDSIAASAARMAKLIETRAVSTHWVATVSACHGVVGQFRACRSPISYRSA